ncbi:MAG TPA: NAD(P)-dependent oxidoreductase [Candidatus Acidoferrum sp.]|nr:NAD(P)-dependent oxidoreductase [Candidatus Acidoferrum sp.]
MAFQKSDQRIINLVTGPTSGLGRAIIRGLVQNGETVRVVLKDVPDKYPELAMLPAGVLPYVADLTFKRPSDQKNLEAACKGVTRVFHIAGATPNTEYTYNQLIEINVIGTENLIKSVLAANPNPATPIHFLYSSSISVYGYKREKETLTEQSEPRPSSHYGESKLMAEHVVESFGESHKQMIYTIMRLATLYGRGYEKPHFFKAFKLVKEGRMRYIGRGNNHLSLLHVDDAADAMLLAAQNPKSSANQVFNIADGYMHTPRQLFTLVANLMGVEPPNRSVNGAIARLLIKAAGISYDEYEFLVSDRVVDISKIRKVLGFTPSRRGDVDGLVMVEDFMKSSKKIRGQSVVIQ